MPRSWQDDLIKALESIGGAGHLSDIYDALAKVRTPLCPSWKGTARCKLQQFSSDSHWWQTNVHGHRSDLFANPRTGYWQLRNPPEPDNKDQPVATDREAALEQRVAELTDTVRNMKSQIHRLEARLRALRVVFFTAPRSRERRNR